MRRVTHRLSIDERNCGGAYTMKEGVSLFMKESKRGLRGGDFGGRGELRSWRVIGLQSSWFMVDGREL